MPDPQPPVQPLRKIEYLFELATAGGQGVLSGLLLGGVWYYVIGGIGSADFLKPWAHAVGLVQQIGLVLLGGGAAIGNILQRREVLKARTADEKIAKALKDLQDRSPGKSAAEYSLEEIAAAAGETNVDKEHFERLVKQQKDRVLIDDEYFDPALIKLLVEYLQPLPRNAKRLMNRFRVNLLVAHSRGLLTTDPKVSSRQIGKWLVMSERWPLLSRALAATPDKMVVLESQTADALKASIMSLSPVYAEDGDLHRFLSSSPPLAPVLTRLVNFGADQPAPAPALASVPAP